MKKAIPALCRKSHFQLELVINVLQMHVLDQTHFHFFVSSFQLRMSVGLCLVIIVKVFCLIITLCILMFLSENQTHCGYWLSSISVTLQIFSSWVQNAFLWTLNNHKNFLDFGQWGTLTVKYLTNATFWYLAINKCNWSVWLPLCCWINRSIVIGLFNFPSF